MPHVPPLAVDLLKAPDLGGDPSIALALDVAADELGLVGQPALLEEVVVDLVEGDELGVALDVAKQPVRVLAERLVEATVLLGARQARGRLHNVDVGEEVGRRVGRLGRGSVLVDVEGDGGNVDALAREVADALEREDGLGAIGESLVL